MTTIDSTDLLHADLVRTEAQFLLVGLVVTLLAAGAMLAWGIVSGQSFVVLLALSLVAVAGAGWAFERIGLKPM